VTGHPYTEFQHDDSLSNFAFDYSLRQYSTGGGTPSAAAPGRVVQVDPTKFKLKPPGTERLKVKFDEPLSNFVFKFKLRRYIPAPAAPPTPGRSRSDQSPPPPPPRRRPRQQPIIIKMWGSSSKEACSARTASTAWTAPTWPSTRPAWLLWVGRCCLTVSKPVLKRL
jgi:hypothetical protein